MSTPQCNCSGYDDGAWGLASHTSNCATRAPAEPTDGEMLDELEQIGFANYNQRTSEWDIVGAKGTFHGPTLRDALKAAMKP